MDEIRQTVSKLLASGDGLGILRRLVIDERQVDSPISLLRPLGFVHLTTVTGIHLYALSGFVNRAVFWLCGNLALARVLAVSVWLFAWALTGFRPGMLRPVCVVGLRTVALHLGFKWRAWAPLAASLSLDLGVACGHFVLGSEDPWAPGRLHYALAVGGGLMAIEIVGRRASVFKQHLAMSVGSWLFVALLDAWALHQAAVYTPLLSLATIPLFSQVLYPGVLIAIILDAVGIKGVALSLATLLGGVSDLVIRVLAEAAMRFNGLWVIPHEALMGALIFASLWVYVRQFAHKTHLRILLIIIAGAIGLSERVFRVDVQPEADRIVQLNVGQGDAAWVCQGGECGMVDAGFEQARSWSRWIDWVSTQDMTEIKWIALTHLDEDHAGGVRRLVRLLPVECVVTAREQWQSIRGQELAVFLRAHGVRVAEWSEECFPYEVLLPEITGSHKRRALALLKNGAMSSVWIPIQGGASYLNAGDADAQAERRAGQWASRLAEKRPGPRILKVTHHGSRYSSTEDFLRQYAPDEAWISSGAKNSYGHPTISVLERLYGLGVRVRRTDQEGDLAIR